MKTMTSTRFISAAATGENWRDIVKNVLEQLESVRTGGFAPNIGFLYVTESLAADLSSIQTLVRSVTGIVHWSGCVAKGVCANGAEYVDKPAISLLAGAVDADDVCPFHAGPAGFKKLEQEMEPWLNTHDPMLVVIHADPHVESQPAAAIEEIDSMVGGFMVGGLSSAREEGGIVAPGTQNAAISGFVFSQNVAVATALTQGCVPIGPAHEISAADNHVIAYLDGRVPFEVFSEDMGGFIEKRMGRKPTGHLLREGKIDEAFSEVLEGQAHVAFPVAGSDQNDFLVRNIVALDPESGVMAVAENISDGQKIMFVHRNDDTVRADLSAALVGLQKRILHENGKFEPRAALYVSCVARAGVSFGGDGKAGGEMALIREILGDIPLAGFYAAGEISNNRLYGYTGVLTLFF